MNRATENPIQPHKDLASFHGMDASPYPLPIPAMSPPDLLVSDIDGTLIDWTVPDPPGLDALREFLNAREGRFRFAVATGRSLGGVRSLFAQYALPNPDVVISSVGTEIHHALDGSRPDRDWAEFIGEDWDAGAVRAASSSVAGLAPQGPESQAPFKVSYFIEPGRFEGAALEAALGHLNAKLNVILSQSRTLDLLPKRASKGRAVRYLCRKLGIPLGRLVVCGDSGNDLDMLAETGPAVVVGNYSPELEVLRNNPRILFSTQPAALGVLEGLSRLGFPGKPRLRG